MPAYIPPLLGLIGLLIALGIFRVVLSYSEGSPEVKKIGDMIHSGWDCNYAGYGNRFYRSDFRD